MKQAGFSPFAFFAGICALVLVGIGSDFAFARGGGHGSHTGGMGAAGAASAGTSSGSATGAAGSSGSAAGSHGTNAAAAASAAGPGGTAAAAHGGTAAQAAAMGAHPGGPPIGTQGVSNVPFEADTLQKPGWPDYNYGSNYDPSTRPQGRDCVNWPNFPACK
jgi:hypothetical protein